MGHIVEECGLEQGGVNLSDFFQIFGTENQPLLMILLWEYILEASKLS